MNKRYVFCVCALCAAMLAACSTPAPTSVPSPVSTATPSAQPTVENATNTPLPTAANTAQTFVNALNVQDYVTAFALLDNSAHDKLKDADGMRREYATVRAIAASITMTTQLRGGLLQQGESAAATLVSSWDSTLAGTFNITSTLPLSYVAAANDWRVMWTRDVIIPNYADGTLVLVRGAPNRGNIAANDGTELAAQDERTSIGVQRGLIADATQEQRMLNVLAQITGLPQDEIKQKYADQPESWFSPVADVTEERIDEFVDQLDTLPMVSARVRYVRTYLRPELAPHVTGFVGFIPPERLDEFRAKGFVGDERIGLTGVEAGADGLLGGQPGGELRLYAEGKVTVLARRDVVRGQDITLTLSPTLQLDVQRLLGNRRGAAVVLDANDAGVLAMASAPTYSPTNVTNAAIQQGGLLNRAVQGLYPPGSTFKMVTMAAGIGEGVTNPTDVFIDPGFWDGYGSDFRKTCWLKNGHGRITLQNGLSASCNIVFYETGKRLEEKSSFALPGYARKFGFGARTGVGLPEAAGVVPDPDWKKESFGESWLGGDTVNMAVGQGYMLVTPLQIAQMTSAIANGGTLLPAHIIANANPQITSTIAPSKLPVSTEALRAIEQGMIGVTTNARYGTTYYRFSSLDAYVLDDGRVVGGRSLTAPQRRAARKFVVAGKSGTAQASGDQKPFAWFTAYAPADNPQIVVTVLLENIGEGSSYAAPLVRQIIESYYGLPLSATPTDRKDAE